MKKYAWLAVFAMGLGGCDNGGSRQPPPGGSGGAVGTGGSGGSGGTTGSGGSGGTTGSGGTGGSGGGAWHSAVGDDGAFAKSYDGLTWTERQVTSVNLYGVACVGNVRGWTVGMSGAILHTEDSGETWQAQASGVAVTLRGVRFADGQIGWVVGDAGTILATRDGGAHWVAQDSGVTVNLNAVTTMGDGVNAWAVGDSGTVLHTSDGATWSRIPSPVAASLNGIAVDPVFGNGWAVGDSGSMLRVTQSGVTLAPFVTSSNLYAVAVPDEVGTTYAAVAVGAFGTILTLAPNEILWGRSDSPTQATLRAALVTAFGGSHAFVAGETGALLMSTSPQSGWQAQDSHTTSTLRGLEDL
jgi:photosystem II stability/assembly factor-like uncharacterized protein